MNQTYIHILITHLPIFGSILGGLVLAYGIWKKSEQTNIAAYILLVISALGASVAYITGEVAEETVEKIQGVVEATIKQHEDFAIYALLSFIILGIVSILGMYMTFKNSLLTRPIAFVILFISIISFGIVARTGYLGGKIRHTEVANGAKYPANISSEVDD